MKSLRSRLLAIVAACTLAFSACVLGLISWSLANASEQLNVDTLEVHVKVAGELWDSAGGCAGNGISPNLKTLDNAFLEDTGFAFKIICEGRPAPISSYGFPDVTFSKKTMDVLNDSQNEEWLVGSKTIDGGILYLASAYEFGFANYIRDSRILQSTLLPILLALLFAAYWMIGRVLKPITQLAQTWKMQAGAVNAHKTPLELLELNDFVQNVMRREQDTQSRNEDLLSNERRFTANAAHELLTPLAAIKTEVQLRERTTNDATLKLWLSSLNERVNRATHTVDQLITLARIEPGNRSEKSTIVNLSKSIDDIIEDLQEQVDRKNVRIEQDYDQRSIVTGNAPLISIMLRNILTNSVKYVPNGGDINISTRHIDNNLNLTIQNSCKELPEYLTDHIFDRFVRGPHETETGSGLGLAIVQKIAKTSNIDLGVNVADNRKSITISLMWPE